MSSVNKVTLLGNVGRDPEIRTTPNGRDIANLTLATSQNWKDKNTGEKQSKTEWHRVVIFNEGLVRVVKNYIKKGSKVYIEGALQTRKWMNKQGQDQYTTEIVMQGFNCSLVMLDSKKGDNSSSSQSSCSSEEYARAKGVDEQLDDNIPF